MDPDVLRAQGFKPQRVELACLKGFGLRIGEKATLVQAEEECSYGTVMELEQKEVEQLYSSPGVEAYVPQSTTVATMVGESIEAVSYILPIDKVAGSNSDYAAALVDVAQKLSLPEEYIRDIKAWI